MDRQQQQQQHIELTCPSRGSLNDGARLVQMCPSLYLAACRGRPEEVMALLLQQHGAGRAGRYQATEMVDLLLEWRPSLAGEVDSDGGTPLHFASSDGDRAVVRTILRAGPPGTVYKKDNLGGLSALHVTARMGHHHVVKDMLEAYPDAAELRGGDGGNFVHSAVREKRSKVVSLAIGKPMLRGLLDAQERDGNAPLHLAVAAGAPTVVEALLRKGKVRADVLNNDGLTPFDLAARSTSFLTMVSLVMTLAAFRAKLRPQRQDHAKPWSGRDVGRWIEKMSEPLTVVAVLIATSAFAAGFNLRGVTATTARRTSRAAQSSRPSCSWISSPWRRPWPR